VICYNVLYCSQKAAPTLVLECYDEKLMVLIKALLIRGTLNYKCNEQNITYSSLAHPSTKYHFINFSYSETSYNENSHVLLNICVRFHNYQHPLRISLLKTCSKGTPFFFQRTFYSQDTFYKSRWTRHSSSEMTTATFCFLWLFGNTTVNSDSAIQSFNEKRIKIVGL
jgi:hypothetical protein